MDFQNSMINKRNGERDWFDNLYQTINQKRQTQMQSQASANIAKYADFQCNDCGAPYTKDFVINHLAGVCNKCQSTDLQCLKQEDEAPAEKMYQCSNCDHECPKSELKKCKCGGTRFVSKELLEQVAVNTADYLVSKGADVEDVWFEKGKVFASIKGVTENNVPWRTVVAASGTFTKDDVLMYTFENNERGGHACVATAQDDPLIKFANNEKCQVYWETEHFDPNENLKLANVTDSRGKQLNIGDEIEWYTPKTVMRGQIINASKTGDLEVGITYDEYGPAHQNEYASIVQLNQNIINNLKVEAYKS